MDNELDCKIVDHSLTHIIEQFDRRVNLILTSCSASVALYQIGQTQRISSLCLCLSVCLSLSLTHTRIYIYHDILDIKLNQTVGNLTVWNFTWLILE